MFAVWQYRVLSSEQQLPLLPQLSTGSCDVDPKGSRDGFILLQIPSIHYPCRWHCCTYIAASRSSRPFLTQECRLVATRVTFQPLTTAAQLWLHPALPANFSPRWLQRAEHGPSLAENATATRIDITDKPKLLSQLRR